MTLEKLIQQIKQRKREIKKYLAPLGKGEEAVLAMLHKSKEWQDLEEMLEDGDVTQEQYDRILAGDYNVIEKPKMRLEGVEIIKGKDGYTPQKGIDYFDGKPGYTPVKGKDYFDGKPGYTPVKGKDYFDGDKGDTPVKGVDYFDGEKGDKPAHKWEETKLTFEQPNGEWGKSVDLKGEKGDKGDMPKHKWDGSILYFEQPNGEWGRGINLKTSKARLGKTGHLGGGTSSGGISAVTDTSTINLTLENNSLSAVVIPSGISHTNIIDIGTNTHPQIDTHIAATGVSVHGLGTISTQAANNVAITGGSVAGITDLAVADGGTGGSVASITLFNNITGYTAAGATGTTSTNLVFSTSPTLVTPILGTPTSGTLTNCTGLPLTGLVNDTTTALGLGSINLGHATDTTIARVSAGVVSIEGINILTTAGGTLTGNITLGEGADPATIGIVMDSSMSADERYSGITVPGTAGATLAFGDLCYLDVTATEWLLADASAAATAGDVVLGICVDASTDGNATSMLLIGTVRSAAFPASIALGAPVYVSETAGDITATQPVTTDAVIRVVGHAITSEPNTIMFNPSNSYITHT